MRLSIYILLKNYFSLWYNYKYFLFSWYLFNKVLCKIMLTSPGKRRLIGSWYGKSSYFSVKHESPIPLLSIIKHFRCWPIIKTTRAINLWWRIAHRLRYVKMWDPSCSSIQRKDTNYQSSHKKRNLQYKIQKEEVTALLMECSRTFLQFLQMFMYFVKLN